jgi:hypothetical protein
MTEAGREMQAASAAHLKILLFIELKQASGLFHLAVPLADKQSQSLVGTLATKRLGVDDANVAMFGTNLI